jgi:predicted cupin superfamily sugar epimerase
MDVATKAPGAADIIRLLDLRPHPEGGHFRETFRDETRVFGGVPGAGAGRGVGTDPGTGRQRQLEGARAASTAIYFLLAHGERSHWHRVDAVEIWHHYAGAPLELAIAAGEGGGAPITRLRLGGDVLAGERPQAIVPAHAWQAAASLGDWTLAGCTVAPGFEFDGFEMAPLGWTP